MYAFARLHEFTITYSCLIHVIEALTDDSDNREYKMCEL